jgi:hypothetical protein
VGAGGSGVGGGRGARAGRGRALERRCPFIAAPALRPWSRGRWRASLVRFGKFVLLASVPRVGGGSGGGVGWAGGGAEGVGAAGGGRGEGRWRACVGEFARQQHG